MSKDIERLRDIVEQLTVVLDSSAYKIEYEGDPFARHSEVVVYIYPDTTTIVFPSGEILDFMI